MRQSTILCWSGALKKGSAVLKFIFVAPLSVASVCIFFQEQHIFCPPHELSRCPLQSLMPNPGTRGFSLPSGLGEDVLFSSQKNFLFTTLLFYQCITDLFQIVDSQCGHGLFRQFTSFVCRYAIGIVFLQGLFFDLVGI